MENPFQSPVEPTATFAPALNMARRNPGMVHHVRVVAILMMVQAGLELLMAVVLGGVAVFMPTVFREIQKEQGRPEDPGIWIVTAIYGGLALVVLAVGMLHLVAGLRNYRLRGRTLGIVALAGGMLSVVTCYCLPTAIALAVYGLIVYLNQEATDAFRMGEAGCEPSEILDIYRR